MDMTKLRPDSTFAKIPAELKWEIDNMLLSGQHTYYIVWKKLNDEGVKVSIASIQKYYKRHLEPLKEAYQVRTAEELDKIPSDGIPEEMYLAAKRRAYELISSPGTNTLDIQRIFSLVLRVETVKQAERKLQLLEDAASKAKETISNTTLTPEEKSDKLKAIFGVC